MIPEILTNLEFFSSLTQRTLSAFHLSGTDETLELDINSLKKYLTTTKHKVIKTVNKIENDKYLRIFTDDSTDIVKFKDLNKPCLTTMPLIPIIDKALDLTYNPISHIKYGSSIIETHNKKIESSVEYLFFIDMLDYTLKPSIPL